MTTLEQRLAATLAEHWEDYPAGCGCGTTVGIATGDALDHAEFHRAHVAAHLAATVREWLGGEQVRQAVADAIAAPRLPNRHSAEYATAALAAVQRITHDEHQEDQ